MGATSRVPVAAVAAISLLLLLSGCTGQAGRHNAPMEIPSSPIIQVVDDPVTMAAGDTLGWMLFGDSTEPQTSAPEKPVKGI